MSPFMICNKCYRVEVAFDVGEELHYGIVWGRGRG